MQVTRKALIEEAYTFDEVVAYGTKLGGDIVGGMPRQFKIGHVTLLLDGDEYLLPPLEGIRIFSREDMLIKGTEGELYPIPIKDFDRFYERTEGSVENVKYSGLK